MIKNSFVELNGRQRAFSLLDENTGGEIVGPEFDFISPHLEPQNIVPESDDGVIIAKGKLDGKAAVIISIEVSFQGGGIGEVSGAKIVAALEKTLEDNKMESRNTQLLFLIQVVYVCRRQTMAYFQFQKFKTQLLP